MATCKHTACELIQDVFSPCVAVLCSSDVESICAKNNLSFVEMVQPFCRLNTEITIRDPSNIGSSIRNFRVVMKDMHFQTPSMPLGKKMMHDAVASNIQAAADGVMCNTVNAENYELTYSASTPWFEAYRDVFLHVIPPTDHEFIHHYLSCIFVVSSSHNDPLSQINDLCQQQAQHQLQNSRQNSRWFFSYIFKYYLLLHDMSSENLAKAEAVYQSMKSSFGSSACHLLQINSSSKSEGKTLNPYEETNGTPNMPDPWSQFLPKYYPQQDILVSDLVEDNSYEFPQHIEEGPENQIADGVHYTANDKGITINHPLLNSSEDLSSLNDSILCSPSKEIIRTSSFGSGTWPKSNNRNKRHGLCLTLSDMDRIRVFVQDFCIQGLVPFIEKQIRILSDQVANRKSIHRTIFGVTKKFFAGNKPGVQGPTASSNSVVYGLDAPELQVRKLGDLAFMFQLFEVAYQAYHGAKRDFSGDQAWLYFAGASEMAALSVFMQGTNALHEYPARYIEAAITTYLHTCKLPELATRATFLSTECLKAKGLYRDAALQFIRMPSEADLPSALCLEQASYCFIHCKPPKIRKYAFHIILAGHRFGKAGQRKHALRAYKQAEQVYKDIGWNFANNHINAMIGRFSLYLNQVECACFAYKLLLSTRSQQPAVEQASYLREYLFALQQFLSQESASEKYELPSLPVPLIDCPATKVQLGEDNVLNEDGSLVVKGRGFERGDLNNHIWSKLEEIVVIKLQKSLPPLHSPQLQCLTQNTENTTKPIAVVNEILSIEIVLKNPLFVPLTVDNVFLLWTFTSQPDANSGKDPMSVTNELDYSKAMLLNSVIQTEVLPRVTLDPLQEQKLHLTLKPHYTGELLIKGIAYSLLAQTNVNPAEGDRNPDATLQKPESVVSLQGKQIIELKGPRLNRTTSERSTKTYASDYRLNLLVVNAMPKLQVKYQSFPYSLFCGEVQQVMIEFSNVGQEVLNRIVVASPTPGLFALGNDTDVDDPFQIYKEVPCRGRLLPVYAEWEYCDWKVEVLMPNGDPCRLKPGETLSRPMWLRGPDLPGEHNLDLLFYYETELEHTKLRHRLVQHSSILTTQPSVSFSANAMKSLCFEDKLADSYPCARSLVLSLEAGNISEELSEVSVVQVSCVSQNWSLCSSDESYRKGFPMIHPQESLHLTMKAVSLSPRTSVSSQKVMVFSHVPMGRVEVDSSATPCSDFSCRSRLNLPDLLTVDNRRMTSDNCRDIDDLEILEREKPTILLLTVIWKAKAQREGVNCIVTGQHHITIEKISSLDAPTNVAAVQSEATAAPFIGNYSHTASPNVTAVAQLVKCSLSHPFHVQHNFRQKRLITLPIEFVAHSTSNSDLQITVDNTDHLASLVPSNLEESQGSMSQNFTWVHGSKREISLKPGRSVHIPLQASFCGPGTYNLGGLSVNVGHDEATTNYTMSPYLVVISACDLPIH